MKTELRQYLETALWSSIDDSGNPLDERYSVDDFSFETIEQARKDISKFLELAGELVENYDVETVMHDFWLTRNHHGAGFWDGDYEKSVGEKLTELSHTFGQLDLYIGDDGKVYGG